MNNKNNNESLFLDKERNIRKYGIEDLNEKNVLPIINRSQKNYALSDDLWDYIQDNLKLARVDEFGKHFTNLDVLDSVNNGGTKTKQIEDLIDNRPKVISEGELIDINLSLKANNWDLDNVPLPSLVMAQEMEQGDLQNVIMGKVSKNMSHFEKEGKENWDVFIDVYTKLNDIAQNFDPNYDFGDKYDFDKLLRDKHGDDIIDNASPEQYKRLLNNQKLNMYLNSNIDKAIYSLIRSDQMAKGMTSVQTEINSDFKQAQQMYGNDYEKIAKHMEKKHENSHRKNKIKFDKESMLKHGKALEMQDNVYLDKNVSSDGRETTIGELVSDNSKDILENMEEQQTIKDFVNNLDKFFNTEAMIQSSDAGNFAWMNVKEYTIDRDPSTGDMLVNSLTPDEINKIKESTYLEAKKRQVLKSFKSNREKTFGKDGMKSLDHNLYQDLEKVKDLNELDDCLNKHIKEARNYRDKSPKAQSFHAMKIEKDIKKIALANTQAYFRLNENAKDVSFIIKEMNDLNNFLDSKIKNIKDKEGLDLALEIKDKKMANVLDDKFELLGENRISENKAPFPESWKQGLFELYNLPMKAEWKTNLDYIEYCEKLRAGEFKDKFGTLDPQMSLFDVMDVKDTKSNLLNDEHIVDEKEYNHNEINYEEVNFLFDAMLDLDKDKSRDKNDREVSHLM
ncbi:hypothetical protein [Peptoniphilus timonensis]|uniref:hypothetical protein n=1 Tax=Peptoniphilus timonensis TaxID=1268254 RepID=UPI0002E7EE2D|nr:hypothetical protein [Peptoniphilus timonensis]